MTPLARQFITPLTMATLSKHPIMVEFFDPENGQWNSHVSLAEWADVFVVAPATANTIAKMATGIADNLLLTTFLSSRCPVIVSPAMDLDMYANRITQANIAKLRDMGVGIVEPEEGELASGLSGKGRMAEPGEILSAVEALFRDSDSMKGIGILVTAGPTVEAIDPVRYISNHSTGKMGYALAGALAARGADVTLVSGPTSLTTPAGVRRIDVVSATDMYEASLKEFQGVDGAILCAAVADYTPAEPSSSKIKKSDGEMMVSLRPTLDIAVELNKVKGGRMLAGFALESDDEMRNATDKMRRKGFDFIVLNSLRDTGACFGGDTNKVTVIERDGCATSYPLVTKKEAAEAIADTACKYLKRQKI